MCKVIYSQKSVTSWLYQKLQRSVVIDKRLRNFLLIAARAINEEIGIWIMTCSAKYNWGHTGISIQASFRIFKPDLSVNPLPPEENLLRNPSVGPPRIDHTNEHSFCHDNHLLPHQLTQRPLWPASNRSGTGRWVCHTMVQHACDVCASHAAP